jgi:hypothetical protein
MLVSGFCGFRGFEKKLRLMKGTEEELTSCQFAVAAHWQQGSFFWLGRTCGWCICNQSPTTGSPSVFCSQKKKP